MTLRQATRGGLDMDLSLALSFEQEQGMTYGLLTGCTKRQAAYIIIQLRKFAMLSNHPLLLPVMILGHVRSFLSQKLDELWVEMLSVEGESGQTRWLRVSPNGVPMRTGEPRDTKKLSTDVLGVIQSATVWQRLLEELIIILEAVLECNNFLVQNARLSSQEAQRTSIEAIEERLRFINIKAKLMLPLVNSFKERTQAQMSAVGLQASKRDVLQLSK
jgi:hypothetical protein